MDKQNIEVTFAIFNQINILHIPDNEKKIIDNLKICIDDLAEHIKCGITDNINQKVLHMVKNIKILLNGKITSINNYNIHTYRGSDYYIIMNSALDFLIYLNDNLRNTDFFREMVYESFFDFITDNINKLIYKPDEFIFKWKLYELLTNEKRKDFNYTSRWSSPSELYFYSELDTFREDNSEEIIKFLLENHNINNVHVITILSELSISELMYKDFFIKINKIKPLELVTVSPLKQIGINSIP